VAGASGFTGSQGARGERGPAGLFGSRGSVGIQGAVGVTGASGPTGEKGLRGPRGDTGPDGPVGSQGRTGNAGLTGQVGPNGDTGASGQTGAPHAVLLLLFLVHATISFVDIVLFIKQLEIYGSRVGCSPLCAANSQTATVRFCYFFGRHSYQQGSETYDFLNMLQGTQVMNAFFYRAMLCIHGTSHDPVSVRLTVCLSVTSRCSIETAE